MSSMDVDGILVKIRPSMLFREILSDGNIGRSYAKWTRIPRVTHSSAAATFKRRTLELVIFIYFGFVYLIQKVFTSGSLLSFATFFFLF